MHRLTLTAHSKLSSACFVFFTVRLCKDRSLNPFVVVLTDCLSQERDVIILWGMWQQGIDKGIVKHEGKWWLMMGSSQIHLVLNWNQFLIPIHCWDWSVNMGEVPLLMSDSNCPETTAAETRLWGLSGWISTWSSSHRSSHWLRVRCFSQLLWQIPPVRPLKSITMINLWLHCISYSMWLIPSNPGLSFEGLFS